MGTTEKIPAPDKRIGGTADKGKNSRIDYKSVKSPLKMKKAINQIKSR